jgi:exodeoxyribonuclease VII small subunit
MPDPMISPDLPSTGLALAAAVPADIAGLGFDDALAELQRTVAELEAGGQPLERALELYERGVALQQHCEKLIGEAELRVKRLVERAGGQLAAVDVKLDEDTG